ncbi:MAG: HaeIII family restriction endonuclease [Leptolyngbyaceae cyanobacterium SL_7_1]|nr:HaeIII family restriction endonuclease [Leptolyngbyaceae cyanobacterium SL_7_1]
MTPRSNLNGRVLEYLIVEALTKNRPNASLTSRAKNAQIRDLAKLTEVDPALLQELNLAANAFLTKWFVPQFQLSEQLSMTIDRLPDRNATDVTDIRLTLPTELINLSIKHNHTALKHQRPGKTPVHCGYTETSVEMQQFKQHYQTITRNFTSQAGGVKLFSDLPDALKEQTLYIPVCNLVSQFINTHASTCAPSLFEYLTGSSNYYKIIINTRTKNLTIQHFSSIRLPNTLVATPTGKYVRLIFDNGWHISIRLHNASSRVGTSPGLKFDTTALTSPIPSTVVSYL